MILELHVDNVLVSHDKNQNKVYLRVSVSDPSTILMAFHSEELVTYLRERGYLPGDMRPELKAILEGKNGL